MAGNDAYIINSEEIKGNVVNVLIREMDLTVIDNWQDDLNEIEIFLILSNCVSTNDFDSKND